MASVFTRIMTGELPGRIVWKDDLCVAMLTKAPIRPGHTLVIPRQEIDHWIDLDPALTAHLFEVARKVGAAIQRSFQPTKVGMTIIGLEVRHVHLHLIPIDKPEDMDFARQDLNAQAEDLDQAADRLRESLKALGFKDHVA